MGRAASPPSEVAVRGICPSSKGGVSVGDTWNLSPICTIPHRILCLRYRAWGIERESVGSGDVREMLSADGFSSSRAEGRVYSVSS